MKTTVADLYVDSSRLEEVRAALAEFGDDVEVNWKDEYEE